MQPALQPGDWLIARHLDDAVMPYPGDIVVVRNTRLIHGRTELSGDSRHMVRVWLTDIHDSWLKMG